MDKATQERIQTLHPKLREEAAQIVNEIDAALTGRAFCRIAQAYRSIDEQNALYAQGRTKPGPIVTNAMGGSSLHNFGLAIDFVLVIDGKVASWDMKTDWDGDKVADWTEVVNIFLKHGWEWGGTWKSLKDYPHFQKTFGLTLSNLRDRYNTRKFIAGTKYVII